MTTSATEEELAEGRRRADSLKRDGEIFIKIAEALKDLAPEAQLRVIKAVAALNGIDIQWPR